MKLYIKEYSKIHRGKKMAFAIPRSVFSQSSAFIMEDLEFLVQRGIEITLYHNLSDNEFLGVMSPSLLGKLKVISISESVNFYGYLCSLEYHIDKLIIIEKQGLTDEYGKKINLMSTKKMSLEIKENHISGLGIESVRFMKSLLHICKAVEKGNIRRVHILPGSTKYAIKHELFSLEGVGTLIGNDFGTPEVRVATQGQENILLGILTSNKGNKYLKPRTKSYVLSQINNFRIASIDGIPVGCVEIIREDEGTVELGALAVIHTFLNVRIGMSLIEYTLQYAISEGFGVISLTNFPKLQGIYERMGFKKIDSGLYETRASKSPGVALYYIDYPTLLISHSL